MNFPRGQKAPGIIPRKYKAKYSEIKSCVVWNTVIFGDELSSCKRAKMLLIVKTILRQNPKRKTALVGKNGKNIIWNESHYLKTCSVAFCEKDTTQKKQSINHKTHILLLIIVIIV